jgi:hypothetical protein
VPEDNDSLGLGGGEPSDVRPNDSSEQLAAAKLREFFKAHREQVFFSRQLEVQQEKQFFHWITNRALHRLRDEGLILTETRTLKTSGTIHVLWHRGYRFYRRNAKRLVELVDEYADPNIGGVIGLHGEIMVLEGFARNQFVMRGRNTREFAGRIWTRTNHNLDFIFERDERAYGVEVKNTLGYMDQDEFKIKIEMCGFLGLRPLFAARMLPRTWIHDLNTAGGYGMIMGYQLYPWTHKELARKVAKELVLPIDAPKALYDGTMQRFVEWHEKQL